MNTNLSLSLLLVLVLTACDQGKKQIVLLESQLTSKDSQIESMTQENAILKEKIYELDGQLGQLKGQDSPEVKAALSQPEKDVQTLVSEVHTGWENLASGGGANSMLVFFLPKYTTSSVNVDISNFAKVRRHNNTNFAEHLSALSEIAGLSIKFDKIQLLYTEIKGDVFTTCYRSRIQVYRNGVLQMTKSVVALVAGEDRDGWKIGTYSWVTLDYAVSS